MNNFGVVELASAKTTSAPGWAYVPDVAAPPVAAAAVGPSRNRKKRTLAATQAVSTAGASELTSRQEAKLRKEFEALDRDWQRDANAIPVKGTAASRTQNKHTPNVRKILQSQKTFANHLDDYYALAALAGANNTHQPHARASQSGAPGAASKRSSAQARKSARREDVEQIDHSGPVQTPIPVPAPGVAVAATAAAAADDDNAPSSTILAPYTKPRPIPHPLDDDPLLASRVPALPNDAELRRLLSEPPLEYTMAAAPWQDGEDGSRPHRQFCEICGYWGRARCTRCGARACALDCLGVHREACLTRYGL